MSLLLAQRTASICAELSTALAANGYTAADMAPYLEQVQAAGNTWNTQRGILATLLGYGVLTSFTLLISCFTSGTIVSIIFGLGAYFIGLFQGTLFAGLSAGQGTTAAMRIAEQVCAVLVPDFGLFAVGDTARPVDGSSDFESEAIQVSGSGSHRADIALGQAASLQVLVFEDRNSDTKVSKYDDGIKGVLVEVLDGDTVVASGETAKKGDVAFTSLKPGTYTLRFTAPEGIGFAVKGDDFAKESIVGDSGSRVAQSDAFTFAAGETVKLNAGVRKVGTFSGRVFEDTDNNGSKCTTKRTKGSTTSN
jgi:hypothetical protein